MAEASDGRAAGGAHFLGHFRASDADREHVVDTLKAAFVQGRLTKDELEARVGQTFASQTYAQLAKVTADIPAGQAAARERAGTPSAKKFVACGLGGWAGISAALLALAFLTNNDALAEVALVLMLCFVMSGVAVVLLAMSNKVEEGVAARGEPR
jgi:hypothetical protein